MIKYIETKLHLIFIKIKMNMKILNKKKKKKYMNYFEAYNIILNKLFILQYNYTLYCIIYRNNYWHICSN